MRFAGQFVGTVRFATAKREMSSDRDHGYRVQLGKTTRYERSFSIEVNMFVLATILFSICCLISETSHAGKQVTRACMLSLSYVRFAAATGTFLHRRSILEYGSYSRHSLRSSSPSAWQGFFSCGSIFIAVTEYRYASRTFSAFIKLSSHIASDLSCMVRG